MRSHCKWYWAGLFWAVSNKWHRKIKRFPHPDILFLYLCGIIILSFKAMNYSLNYGGDNSKLAEVPECGLKTCLFAIFLSFALITTSSIHCLKIHHAAQHAKNLRDMRTFQRRDSTIVGKTLLRVLQNAVLPRSEQHFLHVTFRFNHSWKK